jgi:hypothetical protein
MCPAVLPFSTKGFDKKSGQKRPPNLPEIRLVLGNLSTLGAGGKSSEESMDSKLIYLIVGLLIIVLLLFVMLYIGPFWFFVGNNKTYIFFMTLLIAAVAFWMYLNIRATDDNQKDNIRKFEKIIDKVNLEWERERVDGHWLIGKEAAWIELEVANKYNQKNQSPSVSVSPNSINK